MLRKKQARLRTSTEPMHAWTMTTDFCGLHAQENTLWDHELEPRSRGRKSAALFPTTTQLGQRVPPTDVGAYAWAAGEERCMGTRPDARVLCAGFAGLLCAGMLVFSGAQACAADQETGAPVFRAAADGGFEFDTGVLRGRLAKGGRALGLTDVVHVASGNRIDSSNGLFSFYRVFSRGKRYGGGAWDWPCRARLIENGGVEVLWSADETRPFEMRALYEWRSPSVLEVKTSVRAIERIDAFEVFLASYFAAGFTNSMVLVGESAGSAGEAVFRHAAKQSGDWQMFARDKAARTLILDGRWQLPPNPVDWAIYPVLSRPLGVRRSEQSGIAVALMGVPEDCFAIATPHEAEGHYSMYLSLLGRDIGAGQSTQTRTRLVLVCGSAETGALEAYQRFVGR